MKNAVILCLAILCLLLPSCKQNPDQRENRPPQTPVPSPLTAPAQDADHDPLLSRDEKIAVYQRIQEADNLGDGHVIVDSGVDTLDSTHDPSIKTPLQCAVFRIGYQHVDHIETIHMAYYCPQTQALYFYDAVSNRYTLKP